MPYGHETAARERATMDRQAGSRSGGKSPGAAAYGLQPSGGLPGGGMFGLASDEPLGPVPGFNTKRAILGGLTGLLTGNPIGAAVGALGGGFGEMAWDRLFGGAAPNTIAGYEMAGNRPAPPGLTGNRPDRSGPAMSGPPSPMMPASAVGPAPGGFQVTDYAGTHRLLADPQKAMLAKLLAGA